MLDKRKNHGTKPNNRYSLYNHLLVELIKSIPHSNLRICIDGDVGKKYRKNTLTFLRKQLGGGAQITGFRYADSKTVEELQLADIIVGSINRSYSTHPDAKDYIKLIKKKIVRIQEL